MDKFDPNLICPLCGIRPALHNGKKYKHREHIPPQSLFSNKDNLITVPSCRECNNGSSDLDEKFKIAMGIYLGRKVPILWQKTLRTLRHEGKKSYKKFIIDGISKILVRTPYNDWGYQIPLPANPINDVVKKMARGLHWHVSREILPSDITIEIMTLKQGHNAPEEIKKILTALGKSLSTAKSDFEVLYGLTTDCKHASIWLLKFYGEDCFLVFIKPAIKELSTS